MAAATASATGLDRVAATRYVEPFREGGSLPGLMEADDDGLYVVKFRGAGQGPMALVAEVIAGELARALGLPVPRLVAVDVDPELARAEPDPEIQDLIAASAGDNLGVDFLPGALSFDPGADGVLAPDAAAAIVWFDALVTNVDRSARNPNLLSWHGRTWLIDHGAAFVAQHAGRLAAGATDPFPAIAGHVLLPKAGSVLAADARLAPRLDAGLLARVVGLVPEAWLAAGERGGYVEHLERRLAAPRPWAAEAEAARARA
jgi:hypothetical protein